MSLSLNEHVTENTTENTKDIENNITICIPKELQSDLFDLGFVEDPFDLLKAIVLIEMKNNAVSGVVKGHICKKLPIHCSEILLPIDTKIDAFDTMSCQLYPNESIKSVTLFIKIKKSYVPLKTLNNPSQVFSFYNKFISGIPYINEFAINIKIHNCLFEGVNDSVRWVKIDIWKFGIKILNEIRIKYSKKDCNDLIKQNINYMYNIKYTEFSV